MKKSKAKRMGRRLMRALGCRLSLYAIAGAAGAFLFFLGWITVAAYEVVLPLMGGVIVGASSVFIFMYITVHRARDAWSAELRIASRRLRARVERASTTVRIRASEERKSRARIVPGYDWEKPIAGAPNTPLLAIAAATPSKKVPAVIQYVDDTYRSIRKRRGAVAANAWVWARALSVHSLFVAGTVIAMTPSDHKNAA